VADANHSSPHREGECPCDPNCRLCRLKVATDQAIARLRPVPPRQPLMIAIGIAAPAIRVRPANRIFNLLPGDVKIGPSQ